MRCNNRHQFYCLLTCLLANTFVSECMNNFRFRLSILRKSLIEMMQFDIRVTLLHDADDERIYWIDE